MARRTVTLMLTRADRESDERDLFAGTFFAQPSEEENGWDGYILRLTDFVDHPDSHDRVSVPAFKLSSGHPSRVRAIAEAFVAEMELAIEEDPSLSWYPDVVETELPHQSEEDQ